MGDKGYYPPQGYPQQQQPYGYPPQGVTLLLCFVNVASRSVSWPFRYVGVVVHGDDMRVISPRGTEFAYILVPAGF